MYSIYASYLLPLLVLSSFTDADIHGSPSIFPGRQVNSQPKLSAVTVRSQLHRREEAFKPKHDCSHQYAEVSVEFFEQQSLEAIRPSWDNLGPFLIVSSHPGCNADGERAPHLVSRIHYDNEKATATFSVKPIQWKQAYNTMTVKFGSSPGQYAATSFRTHEGLRRRAGTASSTVSPPPAATSHSATLNLTNPLNSGQRLDPNLELFSYTSPPGVVTESATVSCKNCSLSGTIDIIEGEFTINNSDVPLVGDLIDFVEGGFFQIVANNMAAHIEMDAKLNLVVEKSFNKSLGEYGVPGFSVPGVATIGPFFRPVLLSSIKLESELSFTYGFDLKVPNNSSMTLNIGNITESKIQGFKNANVTALPFQATSPTISLTLGAGIRGELDLGISLGEIAPAGARLEVGAFLDLPKLGVTISTAPDLDEHCDAVIANATSLSTLSGLIPQKFPSLISIKAVVIVDIGVKAAAAIDVPVLQDLEAEAEKVLVGTRFPLPTACLSFDSSKKALVKPTTSATSTSTRGNLPTGTGAVSPESSSAPGTFASTQDNGANTMLDGSLARNLWWSGVGLLSVFLIALSL
ncbi:hypothetical protein BJ875DRAFT_534596 [Amylocarpus encephaloides]|uniref:GPI anchored protein n=1 Tax=Amylocarpus encephaloides TaxID=45428 RepID=A0A9P8C5Y3_9HELO|nr:hypothetical protein BJ875DRAFT_534596 [Amylocarpus encephaloides]